MIGSERNRKSGKQKDAEKKVKGKKTFRKRKGKRE